MLVLPAKGMRELVKEGFWFSDWLLLYNYELPQDIQLQEHIDKHTAHMIGAWNNGNGREPARRLSNKLRRKL